MAASLILEVAVLDVRAGEASRFADAFAQASASNPLP
jgi:hypothetical protein